MSKDAISYLNRRLAELGCDPIEFAAQAMAGFVEGADFPVLNDLLEFFDSVLNVDPTDPPEWSDVKYLAQILRQRCIEQLSDKYVSIDTRIRICLELLNYQHPKLKAVEHSGSVEGVHGAISTLPDDKLVLVLKKALENANDKERLTLLKALEQMPEGLPLPGSMH